MRTVRRYVDLGVYAESAKPFRGDLDIILRSNVLVQANSGGGKSWLLRRFIEQAFKRVPQIIIDPEGEFSTLRSHFDVVLVGKGGDTPADIRSALSASPARTRDERGHRPLRDVEATSSGVGGSRRVSGMNERTLT